MTDAYFDAMLALDATYAQRMAARTRQALGRVYVTEDEIQQAVFDDYAGEARPFLGGGNMGGDADHLGRPVIEGRWYIERGGLCVAGPFDTENDARTAASAHCYAYHNGWPLPDRAGFSYPSDATGYYWAAYPVTRLNEVVAWYNEHGRHSSHHGGPGQRFANVPTMQLGRSRILVRQCVGWDV